MWRVPVFLVTGGGGFIGSHLVRRLVAQGARVRILDNGSNGSLDNIADVADDVEWIDGDVRDADAVGQAMRGVEVVFHHAAVASVADSIRHPLEAHETNIGGTLNVLTTARNHSVRRVICASSAAVYGNLPGLPKHEESPLQPLSPYGVQKLTAESYARVWHSVYGLETVALRYFNVFGPGQDPAGEYAGVVSRFLGAVLDGDVPTIFGDGEQSRDFIYVSDVVEVNLLAARMPVAGTVMNVASGRPTTLNALVAQIGRIVGRKLHPRYQPALPGEVRASVADITLLRTLLDYEPRVAVAEGVERTFQAMVTGAAMRQPA